MYLGIDIGTSAVKAVIVGEQGEVRARSQAPLLVSRLRPLWSEQDPEHWWTATRLAVGGLDAFLRKAVRAIGLSGQMHGATLLDERDKVLRPSILWNDGRSEAECRELEAREPRSRVITGNIAMPGFTAPKLMWIEQHEPDVFRRLRRVLLPKDYVRLCMTGEHATDLSDAAGTLWLDVARRCWSTEMLAATNLTEHHMSRLLEGTQPSGTIRAKVASELGLPSGVVVAAGGGDNAAAAVGVGVIDPGQAFLSLGTSGVIFAADSQFRPHPNRAVHAFCHCLPNRWHEMSVMLSAASCVDWVAKLTGYPDVETALTAAEQLPSAPSTEIFLPYLSGERTPHNDPYAQGVFFGLNQNTTAVSLVRAVLEGVAFGLGDGLDALREAGVQFERLSVVGGGARSSYWGEILASSLRVPLDYRSDAELGPAYGAARLARLAVTGEMPEEVTAPPPIIRTIEPEPSRMDSMLAKRAVFGELYAQLKESFPKTGAHQQG